MRLRRRRGKKNEADGGGEDDGNGAAGAQASGERLSACRVERGALCPAGNTYRVVQWTYILLPSDIPVSRRPDGGPGRQAAAQAEGDSGRQESGSGVVGRSHGQGRVLIQ